MVKSKKLDGNAFRHHNYNDFPASTLANVDVVPNMVFTTK